MACLGNHDFDYPLEEVKVLKARTQTPWLLSNVYDKNTQQPLADAFQTYTREVRLTDGSFLRIGFIGLAEEEWLGLITETPFDSLEYEDYVHCAERLSAELRADGCQIIIALTHMRVHNDEKLMRTLKPGTLDFVLGGHDHVWHWDKVQ